MDIQRVICSRKVWLAPYLVKHVSLANLGDSNILFELHRPITELARNILGYFLVVDLPDDTFTFVVNQPVWLNRLLPGLRTQTLFLLLTL